MKDEFISRIGMRGAGVRLTPLPQAEGPTEPEGLIKCVIIFCKGAFPAVMKTVFYVDENQAI